MSAVGRQQSGDDEITQHLRCVTPGKEVIALNRAYTCLDQRNRII
ncbi:MAG TPA: hypothetical protein VKY19_04535 [Ktedonosporobacter sp.]|nr:hypothetical protein [Ktedonosporobacter sp.]